MHLLYVRSTPGVFGDAARFEQEPRAPLGVVDPHLEEARRRHVAALVAQAMFAERQLAWRGGVLGFLLKQ